MSDRGASIQSNVFAAMFEELISQTWLLLAKEFHLELRGWFRILARILVPLVFMLGFALLLNRISSSNAVVNNNVVPLANIPKCSTPDCIALAYSPPTSEAYEIMKLLAASNGLTIAPTVGNTSMSYDVVAFPSAPAIWKYSADHIYKVQAGISFSPCVNGSLYCPPPRADPKPMPYYTVIWYNPSYTDPFGSKTFSTQDLSATVQNALDEAILNFATNETTSSIEIGLRSYPALPYKADKSQARALLFSIVAPLVFYSILFLQVVLVQSRIAYERTEKLRLGLKMMGLQAAPYWLSILIMESASALVSIAIIIVIGCAFQMNFFLHTNPFVLAVAFWLPALCSISFAIFISCLFHGPIVSIVMTAISYLLGLGTIATFSNPLLAGVFWGKISRVFWMWFYPMNWGKVLNDIDMVTSSTCELIGVSGCVSNSTYFHFANLTNMDSSFNGGLNTSDNLVFLLVDCIVLFVFGVYIDAVWPGEFGVSKGTFFFLRPSFWFGSKQMSDALVETNVYREGQLNSVIADLDPDVNKEYQATMIAQQANSESIPLRVLKLSKTYRKGVCCNSEQDQRALDFLTISGEKGSVLCILGHNGAGKTTLISALTGIQSPSFGDAFVYGKSIISEMDDVRRMSGVCPQHDILWEDMTAEEHLELFCRLKRIPQKDIPALVARKLEQVGLEEHAKQLAQKFSGGMKRRLSVAIASIGEPPIIFLDEPTSGLDPKNRRSIWKMITNLRQTSLVVLTTHSMEEADTLGDKIAILALGRLRAIGTSTHLKNRFGYGYHINMIVPPHRSAEAKSAVTRLLPEAHLDAETAGNLSYSLERARIEDVSNFFRFVEAEISKEESTRLVLDWGLSQTTMEEVFLRLTHGDTRLKEKEEAEQKAKANTTGFYTDEQPPVRNIAVTAKPEERQLQQQPLAKDFEALRNAFAATNAQNQKLAAENAQLLARLQELEALVKAKNEGKQ